MEQTVDYARPLLLVYAADLAATGRLKAATQVCLELFGPYFSLFAATLTAGLESMLAP